MIFTDAEFKKKSKVKVNRYQIEDKYLVKSSFFYKLPSLLFTEIFSYIPIFMNFSPGAAVA